MLYIYCARLTTRKYFLIFFQNKDKTLRLLEGESAVFPDFDPRQSQDIFLEVNPTVFL